MVLELRGKKYQVKQNELRKMKMVKLAGRLRRIAQKMTAGDDSFFDAFDELEPLWNEFTSAVIKDFDISFDELNDEEVKQILEGFFGAWNLQLQAQQSSNSEISENSSNGKTESVSPKITIMNT